MIKSAPAEGGESDKPLAASTASHRELPTLNGQTHPEPYPVALTTHTRGEARLPCVSDRFACSQPRGSTMTDFSLRVGVDISAQPVSATWGTTRMTTGLWWKWSNPL